MVDCLWKSATAPSCRRCSITHCAARSCASLRSGISATRAAACRIFKDSGRAKRRACSPASISSGSGFRPISHFRSELCCSTWSPPSSISRTCSRPTATGRQKLSPLVDRIKDRYGRCAIGSASSRPTCGRSRGMPPFTGCRRAGSFDHDDTLPIQSEGPPRSYSTRRRRGVDRDALRSLTAPRFARGKAGQIRNPNRRP
jgi:hypothetical protein